MSRQALEAIIGRAVVNEEFRLLLFADPEMALVGYELTEKELAALRKLDAESLEGCNKLIARRVMAELKETAPDDFPLDAI